MAGSHLEATHREAVPEHPGPGLAPYRLSWQGDKEDPPHPFQEKAHRVHTALSAWAWAISRCRIPPISPPVYPLVLDFCLLASGRRTAGEREAFPGKAVSPQGGNLSCALALQRAPFGPPPPPPRVSASPQGDRNPGHKASRHTDPTRVAQLRRFLVSD